MSSIHLNHIHSLAPENVPFSDYQFLRALPGPTVLHIEGEDSSTTRVIVTLLHGNEPSGFRAIHRILKEGFRPVCNVKVIIASVVAARTEPIFTHRMLPGQRDLNRCFCPAFADLQGKFANAISDYIHSCNPQAVIDLHNTSGSGPAFSVSVVNQAPYRALASHFSHWFIHTDIRLHSLMEVPFGCPVVTIEAGGAQDEEANIHAYEGLKSFLSCPDPFVQQQNIEQLNHPTRLEIAPEAIIRYAEKPDSSVNITLCQDIERHNFGITQAGDRLGWVDAQGLAHFSLSDRSDQRRVEDYFAVDNGELVLARPLRLFMVTSRPDIAKSDCLLYFVDVH